jgi:hypothetical protein
MELVRLRIRGEGVAHDEIGDVHHRIRGSPRECRWLFLQLLPRWRLQQQQQQRTLRSDVCELGLDLEDLDRCRALVHPVYP